MEKESMQNTIKSLQQRTENIEKLLEKGNDVIVFQYGSDTIKFGFANQQQPQKMKNIIAYKVNKDDPDSKHQPKYAATNFDQFDQISNQVEQELKQIGVIKTEFRQPKGKPKNKQETSIRVDYGKEKYETSSKQTVDHPIVFGNDVAYFEQRDDYIIKKPIKHGFFNMNEGKETILDVINDLERITIHILTEKMNLSTKNFSKYQIILVVPDIFQRQQVKALINMFLSKLQFKAIFIHLESVLATFGANISQACVVDIGYQKINVCCVEEGIILNNTLIRKNFGGEDMDIALCRLLQKRHSALFRKKGGKIDMGVYGDMESIAKVKEEICCFKQTEDSSNKIYEVNCIRDEKEETYNVFHNESAYIAPASIFTAGMFESISRFKTMSKNQMYYFDFMGNYFDMYWDSEDYLEEFFSGGGTLKTIYRQQPGMSYAIQQMQYQIQQQQQNSGNNQDKQQDKQQGNDANKMDIENNQEETKQENEKQQSQPQQQQQSNQKENAKVDKTDKTEKSEKSGKNEKNGKGEKKGAVNLKEKLRDTDQNEEKKEIEDQMYDPFQMMNVEQIVTYSISQCKDVEQQKKMANNILIVGGICCMKHFTDEFEDRLIDSTHLFIPSVERVEVLDTRIKEIAPNNLSWVGATVIPRLDSTKDMWISRSRWIGNCQDEFQEEEENGHKIVVKKEKSNEYGIRYLKEKIPFQW